MSVVDILDSIFASPAFAVFAALLTASVPALLWFAPRRPLPQLPSREMELVSPDGGVRVPLLVEVAKTAREQRTGLMFRHSLPDGAGMLFRWPRPSRTAIWMRNVRFHLDLVFLAQGDVVIAVIRRRPGGWGMSGGAFRSAALLELSAGVCARAGVGPGWRLSPVSRLQGSKAAPRPAASDSALTSDEESEPQGAS